MARATAIGLMSGTSYDGVDVALVETDGEDIGNLGPTGYRPYSDQEREVLRRAMAVAVNLKNRTDRPKPLAEAEELVTDMHADAVESFLAANGMAASAVTVIGFHGQTVLHRPDRGVTVQLGNGPALAARLGIPVVYDLRGADVAAGGQGAPVVPVFHRAMLRLLKRAHPVAVLNLGGVANLTFIDGEESLLAFDTGPGNALIDDFLQQRSGQLHDDGGRAAAAGQVDGAAVARVLAHPFFVRQPPKSLDRNAFRHWVAEEGRLAGKSTEDGAATLTAITAAAVAHAVTLLPRVLDRRRRRHAQSDVDADAGGAAQAGAHRDRGRRRLVGRRARGPSLRLSRGAIAEGTAADFSRHDRGAAPAHRRRAGALNRRRRSAR
jgi:anhydro-N-acetylmuramic acid kinase